MDDPNRQRLIGNLVQAMRALFKTWSKWTEYPVFIKGTGFFIGYSFNFVNNFMLNAVKNIIFLKKLNEK